LEHHRNIKNAMEGTKKIINKLLLPIVRFYWFIFRPESEGVKCIIENEGYILLIRNTYGHKQWTFPGGHIEKNENPEEAVIREVKEEIGIQIEDLRLLGKFLSTREYKKDNIFCFSAKAKNKELYLGICEILEAKWFTIAELPPLGPIAQKVFDLWNR